MTEHPVTLGDLRVFIDPPVTNAQQMVTTRWTRPATVADLMSPEIRPLVVSALRAEGVLVVESSVRHNWPAWAVDVLRYDVAALAEKGAVAILDALAEAQPFPPAGE